ncbi:hypothetical protein [Geobacter sp.]|uniref:hypothetical protein n=1 Tax=Geobacter sp. TaxID=46610 RepID=UPI0026296318|nr:hypothetical protein [Geobacter sp.]
MKLNIKAALLSGLVLPGLGQFASGRRVRGGILLVLANIFLLAAVFLLLREMGPVFVEAKLTGKVDAAAIAAKVSRGAPAARALLACFAGLWCFAVVDALFDRGPRRDDTPGE